METAAPANHIQTINPATGRDLRTYEPDSAERIDRKLAAAHDAFRTWRTTSFAERSAILHAVAARLRADKTRIAEIATREMGKPIVEAEGEIEKCAWSCDFYADNAEAFLASDIIATNAAKSYVAYRPLGPVLAIMPWNFPFWQVFRFAAPALMAGNVGVLKHAANVTECALEIERIFSACGLPDGAFSTLVVAGRDMEHIVSDKRIVAVTLTGSEGAGSAVAAVAGKVLKKTVLELGGSDAFVVLADADVAAAAKTAVRARFQNTGQSCIAAKRFIVESSVHDDFLAAFADGAKKLVIGDPEDRATQIGPLAREDLRAGLDKQVRASLDRGADLVTGGEFIDRPGYYYAPTILANVNRSMDVFTQETFGPAAAVIRAKDAEDAIALANDSPYGLGGNLWTSDVERGERLAARFESGAVFINGMTSSDPRLPFGGVKLSGYGRELSHFGIQEFVNIQTIWIGPASG